ncbi:MAG: filamentous hemagglutinin N-terminal domain-containing protein [Candidatus Omnitrophica bacterium]|nr:filamentous hemagglutinin N-terminal domain-containing protein [Candidatus Omnitrophota bacterium]
MEDKRRKQRNTLIFYPLFVLLIIGFMIYPFTRAFADDLPVGPLVQIGAPTITTTGNDMTVNANQFDKTWIDWQGGFNIGSQNSVNNIGPAASAVILHNDVSGVISNIQGALSGNCNVFLLNPSGILFGSGAQVNVGGLVASTMRMSMNDFMSGSYILKQEDTANPGLIANAGKINASGPMGVSLVGGAVRNTGVISANLSTVNLASGKEVTLNANNTGSIQVVVDKKVLSQVLDQNGNKVDVGVENLGEINANGGRVYIQAEAMQDIFEKLINQEGVVKAGSMVEQNGKIILVSDSEGIIQNTGTLDASAIEAGAKGGEVEMRGEKVGQLGIVKADALDGDGGDIELRASKVVALGPDSETTADAGLNGDGGNVVVFSPDTALMAPTAKISVRGGDSSGDGGFVEVSGQKYVEVNGIVDRRALNGQAGLLYIDPVDLTIDDGAADPITWTVHSWANGTGNNTTTMDIDVLMTNHLALGDTVIDALGGDGAGNGDIILNAGKTLTNNTVNDLTLTGRNITVTAGTPINFTVAGANLNLNGTGAIDINDSITLAGGSFDSNGTTFDNTGGAITTAGGNIDISGHTGAVIIGAALNSGIGFVDIDSTTSTVAINKGITTTTGNVTIDSAVGSTTTVGVDGDIQTTTGTVTFGATRADNLTTSGDVTTTIGGNITLSNATTLGGSVTFDAGNQTFTSANTINAATYDLTITSDTIALGGNFSGTGNLILQPYSVGQAIGIGSDAPGAFSLVDAEVGYINNGGTFSSITIGRSDGRGLVTINPGTGTTTFSDPVIIRSGGLGGSITVNEIFTTVAANSAVTFTAGTGALGIFTLTEGAGNTIASGNGAIIITADRIALNTVGTITGGSTITLQPASDATTIGIAGAVGDFALSTDEITSLTNGFSGITIGRAGGTGGATISAVTFNDPVTIRSPSGGVLDVNDQITGAGNASVHLTGATNLGANIATNNSEIHITGNVTRDTADALILTTQAGGAGAGDITITGNIEADVNTRDLTFTAGTGVISVTGTIGAVTNLSDLTITSSGGATFTGAVTTATSVILTDTTDAANITFTGALITPTLTTAAEAYDLDLLGSGTVIANAVTFTNTGILTIGDAAGDTITFTAGVDATAPSALNIAGTIAATTGASAISLGDSNTAVAVTASANIGGAATGLIDMGDATLADGATLTLGTGIANAINLDTVTGTAAGTTSNLTINTTGVVAVAENVGATDIGTITITNSGGIVFSGTVSAATLAITDTTDGTAVSFLDNLTASAAMTVAANGSYRVYIYGTTNSIAGTTTFGNSGTVIIGNGASDNTTFTDGVIATAPSALSIAGTIAATTGASVITLGDSDTAVAITHDANIGGAATGTIDMGDATLADGVTLTVGTGIANAINLDTVTGTAAGTTSNLTINTTGVVSVAEAVGADDIGTITITNSGGITFASTVSAATLTITDTTDATTLSFVDNLTISSGMTAAANGAYQIFITGGTNSIAGTTTFNNTGLVILGDASGDSIAFTAGVTAIAPSSLSIAGTIAANTGVSTISLGDGNTPVSVTASANIGGAATGLIDIGDATLSDGATLTVGTGIANAINLDTVTGTAAGTTSNLTINTTGVVAVAEAVGAVDIGTVTITNSGGIVFSDAVTATVSVVLTDTTDAANITFTGALITPTLTTAAQAYDLDLLGSGTIITNAVTFANTGVLTLGDAAADTLLFNGGLTALDPSGVTLNGQIRSSADTISIGDALTPVTLAGTLSIIDTTNNGAGGSEAGAGITVNGAVSGTADNTQSLTLNAGTGGAIAFGSTIGATAATQPATLTVTNSNGATFTGAVTTDTSVVLTDTTDAANITFTGALITPTLTTAAQAYDLDLLGSGTVITNDTNFLNTGIVTLGDNAGDTLTFTGGLATIGNVSNPSATNLAGTIATTNTNMDLGASTATAAITLSAGTGTITLASSLAGGANALTFTADEIDFSGGANSITGTSTILLQPSANNTTIGIGTAAVGTLNLSDADIAALTNGFSLITIGRSTGTAAIDIRAITFHDPATIQSPDPSGTITVNGILRNDNGSGTLTLDASPTTITLNADIITDRVAIVLADNVIINGAARSLDTTNGGLSLAGANISITGATDSTAGEANGLTLNAGSGGNITLTGAVGSGVTQELGGVTITQANDVTFSSTVEALWFDQTDSQGTLTFSGDVTTTGLTGGYGIDVRSKTNIHLDNNVDLNSNVNPIRLRSDSFTFDAGATITGSSIALAPYTAGTVIGVEDNTKAWNVTDAMLDAIVGPVILGDATSGALTIANGAAGGNINLTQNKNLTFISGSTVNLIGVGAGPAITTTAGGTVTITNTGVLTINAAGDLNLAGAFLQDGAGAVLTAGDITTTSDAITFTTGTTLTGSIALSNGGGVNTGDIWFKSTLTGTTASTENLTLSAGAGSIKLDGQVGATRLGDILINDALNFTPSSTISAKTLTQTTGTGTTQLDNNVDTTGNITLNNGIINIGAAANITSTSGDIDLESLTGSMDLSGNITAVGNSVTLTSAANITDPTSSATDITADDLTITANSGSVGASGTNNELDTDVATITASVGNNIYIYQKQAVALPSVVATAGVVDIKADGTITTTTVSANGGYAVNLYATAGDIVDTTGGLITGTATSSLKASGVIGTTTNPVDVNITGDLWILAGARQNEVSAILKGTVNGSAATQRVEIFEPSPPGLVIFNNHLMGGGNYGSGSVNGSILNRGYGTFVLTINDMYYMFYNKAMYPWLYKTTLPWVLSQGAIIDFDFLKEPPATIDVTQLNISAITPLQAGLAAPSASAYAISPIR